MKNISLITTTAAAVALSVALIACKESSKGTTKTPNAAAKEETKGSEPASETATTKVMLQPDKAAQDKLTPASVLANLKEGNKRYQETSLTKQSIGDRIKAAQSGQYPKAYILSCVDSRVPVETVFDQSIGDIFVGRVAGNVENNDQLGSMEYAAAVAGIKLIVVMGHESCGAVKSACDDVKLGNISSLLQKIRPAVLSVDGYQEKSSKDKDIVKKVIHANVKKTIGDIRNRSEVLADLEAEGKIKIVGAYYTLGSGAVDFIE